MTSVPSERRTRGSEDDTSQEKEETDGTARVTPLYPSLPSTPHRRMAVRRTRPLADPTEKSGVEGIE